MRKVEISNPDASTSLSRVSIAHRAGRRCVSPKTPAHGRKVTLQALGAKATMPTRFLLYQLVDGHTHTLDVAPRLASWDAAGTPGQVALASYLDRVEQLLGSSTSQELSALHLIVHHNYPAGTDPGHDLDNYLYPLVRRLGPDRFQLVRASKTAADPSQIVVGQAALQVRLAERSGWHFASATTTGSADKREWKQQIHNQLSAVVSRADASGPVEVELALRVGPRRNWINLWKPAIDSLGPIIGEGHRPFAPRDDLIIELGLHQTIDHDLGHQVELGIWWKPAKL